MFKAQDSIPSTAKYLKNKKIEMENAHRLRLNLFATREDMKGDSENELLTEEPAEC